MPTYVIHDTLFFALGDLAGKRGNPKLAHY